jgi:hypothetical protein
LAGAVAKLAGINLLKFGSFSYWFDKPRSHTEGRLAAVLIITFSWGFQLGSHLQNSYINTTPSGTQVTGSISYTIVSVERVIKHTDYVEYVGEDPAALPRHQ